MDSPLPFSIPHIVDSICDYLNLDDIVNCKKVCKVWADVFGPSEWQSLHLANYDENWSPSPEKRNLILKHAHRIKSLTFHQDDIWLLESLCINFKCLTYVHDPCNVYLSTHSSVLQDVSRWTELKLSYPAESYDQPGIPINPVVLAEALSNCPPCVESLHVSYYFSYHGVAEPLVPRNVPSAFTLPWKQLSLRKFHFVCDYSCSFQSLINVGLLPFLRNCCPLLEDLSLPPFPEENCEALMKTIGAHCPFLQSLTLNNEDISETPFGYEVDYFGYITQPLKFLKIDLNYKHDTLVLEPLRRNGSDALEALEFLNTEYYCSEYVPPYDWFPNLQTVKYSRSHRSSGTDTWTRPVEPTERDHWDREDAREHYTSRVNM